MKRTSSDVDNEVAPKKVKVEVKTEKAGGTEFNAKRVRVLKGGDKGSSGNVIYWMWRYVNARVACYATPAYHSSPFICSLSPVTLPPPSS
jgi:hypothetical protein